MLEYYIRYCLLAKYLRHCRQERWQNATRKGLCMSREREKEEKEVENMEWHPDDLYTEYFRKVLKNRRHTREFLHEKTRYKPTSYLCTQPVHNSMYTWVYTKVHLIVGMFVVNWQHRIKMNFHLCRCICRYLCIVLMMCVCNFVKCVLQNIRAWFPMFPVHS